MVSRYIMTIPTSPSPTPFESPIPTLAEIYAPIQPELEEVKKLYRETILESPEQRHLHEILTGDRTDPITTQFRVEVVERISKHLLRAEGKWHRAGLTALAAATFDARGVSVHQVAAAVELVHRATLIHDDVIDEAEVRRGQQSVCSGWGNSVAVLVGDFLFCRAFKLLLASGSIPSQTALTIATGQMCLGEIKQLGQACQFATTESQYLETIGHKTASLIAAATAAGGYIAGVDEDICGRLDHFGYSVGMAFQITDDLLDYRSTAAKMGKEAGGDLRNGKLTLPLIHLVDRVPESRDLARKSSEDPKYTEALHTLMTESGSFDYAFALAQRYLDGARADLAQLRERGGAKDCLDALGLFLDFIYAREK